MLMLEKSVVLLDPLSKVYNMSNGSPKVSVIIPSYNHEKFIGRTLQSVIDQTFQDFEIIVTDDGSSDGTVDEIKKCNDSRIRLFELGKNYGASYAMNNCIKHAKGEYIAVLNSDDLFEPEKLEKELEFLHKNPSVGAVFSWAHIIDENGEDYHDKSHFYYDVFEKENRSRHEWLRFFFDNGNCLCHPSVLIRSACYEDVGTYNPRFAQLPDFDMWIRLCLKYEIHIMPEKLTRFRVINDEMNASGNRLEVVARSGFEHVEVLKSYLNCSIDELHKIFPDSEFGRFQEVDPCLVPYMVARLALVNLDKNSVVYKNFASQVLYEMMSVGTVADMLKKVFDFSYSDFFKIVGTGDVISEQQYELKRLGKIIGGTRDYIEQLEGENVKKKDYIEQLEGENVKKKGYIEQLEGKIVGKNEKINTLKEEAMPMVDIVSINYNSKRYIDCYLRGISNIDYPTSRFRVFIVDNASQDDSWDYVNKKVEELGLSNVHLIKLNSNTGFTGGNNVVFRLSKADYIFMLNIDTEIDAACLRKLVEKAEGDLDIGIAEAKQTPNEHPKYYDLETGETSWSSGACSLIRRKALQETGYFDQKFFLYCEDVDLSWRMWSNGWKCVYVPEAECQHFTLDLAEHKKGGGSMTEFYFGMRNGNMMRFIYGSRWEWIKYNLNLIKLALFSKWHNWTQKKLMIKAFLAQFQHLMHLSKRRKLFSERDHRSNWIKFYGWDYSRKREIMKK